MTASVSQALSVALPDRAKSDAPRQKGSAADEAFADAVNFGKAGRQTRHASATDAAGESHRMGWNADLDVRGQDADDPIAADGEVHPRWKFPIGFSDAASEGAANAEEPDSGPGQEKAAPNNATASGMETLPNAFRAAIPPIILLGGYGRPEAGAASKGDLSALAEPASQQVGAELPTPQSDKPGAIAAKAAVSSPPSVSEGDATGAGVPQAAAHAAQTVGGDERKSPTTSPANAAETVARSAPGGGVETTGKSSATGHPGDATVTGAAKPVARDSTARESSPDTNGMNGRVVVLAQQNIPAPAAPSLAAAPLLTAIAADGAWRALASAADLNGLPMQNAVASTLKVQLRPAELGIVTASLRFSGEQLTIELQVESAEAQQRLSADSDAIVKSLRALGLEVERVTVQQSGVVQPSNTRTDTNAGQNGQPAPDRQSFNAASSGGGNGQAGDQQPRGSTSNGAQESRNVASGGADRVGGGLYI